MFAYVKFLEGSSLGTKVKVPVSKIKYNFTDKQFDASKKYLVQGRDNVFVKAVILHLEENEVELDKSIQTKKLKYTNTKQLVTTEESEPERLKKNIKNKLQKNESIQDKKELHFRKFADLTHVNINDLKVVFNDNMPGIAIPKQHNALHTSSNNANRPDQSEVRNNKVIRIKKVETIKNPTKFDDHETGTIVLQANSNANQKVSIEKIEKSLAKESPSEDERNINKLQDELKIIQNNLQKLEQKYRESKKKLDESRAKNSETELLNKRLQTILYEKFQEEKELKQQSQQKSAISMSADKNFLPVGKIRESDQTIHLGRNIWLAIPTYDNIVITSKSPSQFIGNVLTSVFGTKILMHSTVTGKISNKSLGRSKKSGINPTTSDVEKLDSTKLQACQDIYGHWLQFEYTPPDGLKGSAFLSEIHEFNTYVSKKISYLKRQQRKNEKTRSEGIVSEKILERNSCNQDIVDHINCSDTTLHQNIQNKETLDENVVFADLIVPKSSSHSDLCNKGRVLAQCDESTGDTSIADNISLVNTNEMEYDDANSVSSSISMDFSA